MAFKIESNIVIDNNGDLNSTMFRSGTYANTKITSSDIAANDDFGIGVGVGDGKIVVGARGDNSDTGAAYIFDLDGNQLSKITGSDITTNDWFGVSVGVGCGRIVVGASQYFNGTNGAAYIFDLDGTQIAKITASDGAAGDAFGQYVAIGCNRIVVGAYRDDSQQGSAYVFNLAGTQIAKLTAPSGGSFDWMGANVAIGSGRIVVGAPLEDDPSNSGSVYVYNLNGDYLFTIPGAIESENFGLAVAAGEGRIVVGASGTNGFYIYDINGNLIKNVPSSEVYGSCESACIGGGVIVFAESYSSSNNTLPIEVFDLNGNKQRSLGSDINFTTQSNFGIACAIGCNRLVVTDFGDSENGTSSGAAYIFDIDETINTHWDDNLSGFGIKD